MKATLKSGWYILSFSIFISLMASCFKSYEYDEYSFTDAELLYFNLSHTDSLPELEQVVFSIDQKGEVGMIYNYDSMAFQTVLPEKVIIDYLSGAGTNNVINITNGDSIWIQPGDSIDISTPQTLKVYALDGVTTKIYIAQLNIHQIDPDSVQYNMIASDLSFLNTEDTKTIIFNDRFLTYSKFSLPPVTGYSSIIQLHSSSDAINWIQEPVSGLPANAVIRGIQSNGNRLFAYTEDGELYVRYDLSVDQWILANKPPSIKVKSILGYLNACPNQQEGLCLVIETGGIHTFAFTNDLIQWDYDSINPTPVPEDFPLYDFSNHSYQVMLTERITIFGGLSLNGDAQNSVWSTENGLYWAKLSGSIKGFPKYKGVNVFYYNNEFWLINGIADNDYHNREVYYSIDGGITWTTREVKCQAPEEFLPRYNASLVMDKNNKYFYIIGGKNDGLLPEVWKGLLNKSEFEH